MYNNMKLQDLYRYDSAVWGIDGIYQTIGNDSFFINSSCIVSPKRTITTGETYLLIGNSTKTNIDVTVVKLIDVYCDNVFINIILQNVLQQSSITIQLNVHENHCSYLLMDVSFINKEIERFIVMRYCNCTD